MGVIHAKTFRSGVATVDEQAGCKWAIESGGGVKLRSIPRSLNRMASNLFQPTVGMEDYRPELQTLAMSQEKP